MFSVQKTFKHFGTPTYAVEITQIKALLDEVEVSMRVPSGGTAMIILILLIDLFD